MPVVATYSSSLTTNGSPKSVSVTTQPGDIVVVSGGGESEAMTLDTPTGNGIAFTLRQSIVAPSYSTAYIWTGVDAVGGTWNLSVTTTSAVQWGFTVIVVRDATVGGSVKNNASGTATIGITTTGTDSDVVVFNTDWNATNGSGRVWTTVNGTTPTAGNLLEAGYGFTSGAYTIYSAYYPDTGAPGAKTVGLSQPTGQKYSIIAIELIRNALPPVTAAIAWFSTVTSPALRAAAINSANSANSLGVTIPASTVPGDLLVLTVAQASFSATLFNAISGWTKRGEQRAGGAAHTIAVFTRVAQPGDAGTTVTSTSVNTENYTAQLRVYYGVNTTTPLDNAVAFAQLDPAATSASAPSIVAMTSQATVVTAFSIPTTVGVTLTDDNWTGPNDFSHEITSSTNSAANNAALAMYDKSGVSIGTQGPFTASVTDSRRWALASIVLRAATAPVLYDSFAVDGYFAPQWATQPGTISSGRLNLTTTAAYSGVLTSFNSYSLAGRTLSVHAPVVPAAASGEAWVQIGADDNNRVIIGKGGGTMVLRIINAGVYDDQYVGYNATNHAWWRLKLTGTLLEWQTSPDNVTWATLRSATSGYPDLTAGYVQIVTGHYNAGDPDEAVAFEEISLS